MDTSSLYQLKTDLWHQRTRTHQDSVEDVYDLVDSVIDVLGKLIDHILTEVPSRL